jgi:hypothetical protein
MKLHLATVARASREPVNPNGIIEFMLQLVSR